jgi:aspartyl/asparaginyl beta-hydroxylase (cupin superfamily)
MREPIYFYIYKDWYTGKLPPIYKPEDLDFHDILTSNYEAIREEVLKVYSNGAKGFKLQYAPYKFDNNKWKVCSFYGFQLRYQDNLKAFPVLAEVLKKIPLLVTAQISVLGPNTRVKPHFGGSSAIIRSHLGLVITGAYPELGLRIRTEELCWEEGKVISFCESYRHYVWNNSSKPRIILLIDTVHPDYRDKKLFISAGVLAMLVLKVIVTKFPITKRSPKWLVFTIHRFFTAIFMSLILVQDYFKLDVAGILQKLKPD